jgi:hypothetical protein
VVVSVSLTIRGDVHQLRPGTRIGKTAQQPLRELLAVVEQALERHCL